MFSTQSSGPLNAVVDGAASVVTDVTSGAVNMANNIFKSVNKATNTAVNTVTQNIPSFESIMPIGQTSSGLPNNASPKVNAIPKVNASPNANVSPKANVSPNAYGNSKSWLNYGQAYNNSGNSRNDTSSSSWFRMPSLGFLFSPLYIFIFILIVFLIVFAVFNDQIKHGYQYMASSLRNLLNLPTKHNIHASISPGVTVPPQPPQTLTPSEQSVPHPSQTSMVEKILPASGQEVFNVAQNKFTYYDAEPLCKALGAELATYEQVKDAWNEGADWCNYGWVKGQMAVYPTQKETYDRLQMGPPSEKNTCGTVGVNGGYFDNPEFKYGVNCYGNKPSQSGHDQAMLMAEGKAPKSPETLKIDQMVREFESEKDSLFVKPFNNEQWGEV